MSLHTLELSGTPREMGRQHGEQLRDLVRGMIETRLELATRAAESANQHLGRPWCLDLAAECVPFLHSYAPAVHEELGGIAEASGFTLPELVIGNGWTDFRDLLSARVEKLRSGPMQTECTSLALGGDLTADGRTYLAQTWDMNVTAAPYLVLITRRPAQGPVSVSLTTAGCLSLIGMNQHGIAVGNTNLCPTDARPGVFYLALIHHALAQSQLRAAVEAIAGAHRMSGHYYHLGGPQGEFMGIETTGRQHDLLTPALGRTVHTNHYLRETLLARGLAVAATANSLGRQDRMERLTAGLQAPASVTDISQLLANHEGDNPICRHSEDPAGAASLGAVVMCPQTREMWVTGTNPCLGDFSHMQL